MDTNEKLGWVERVNHASEEQAKRTLNFMILKCNAKTDTIARAIRDAIERHTPTPTIVYQQPESEDDGEAALALSHKKSSKKKKKKKDQDGSSQDEEDAPSTTSKKRRSTRRGDINPDPLVEQLILKKTKTKLRRSKKRISDHDEDQNSPDVSDKIKSNHASETTTKKKQHTYDESLGTPSKQEDPPIIDLVTSSDEEACDTEQTTHRILDDKSSDDDSSDNDSLDDSSSDSHSSDDGHSKDETHGGSLADGVGPFHESPDKEANKGSARGGDAVPSTPQPSTNSTAKILNQNSGTGTIGLGSGKKRKAPEHTAEDAHKDTHAESTIIDHINKRSKQNHPLESQRLPEYRTCRKCDILFPSVAQLLKHQLRCKNSTATLVGHHRSGPPSDDHCAQPHQAQKAGHSNGDSLAKEPHNTLQLPSRPRRTSSADRGLSVPPPSFVHEPNNFPRGPKPTAMALARSVSGSHSSPPGLVHCPVSKSSSQGSSIHQSRPSKQMTQERERYEKGRKLHQCQYCKIWYRNCENLGNVCNCHPGMCRFPYCQSKC